LLRSDHVASGAPFITAAPSSTRALLVVCLMGFASGSLGCWEQNSAEWWPQMKRQLAVQAYEYNPFAQGGAQLMPPEGTVPVGDPYLDVASLSVDEQEALANPVPATLASLKNGEKLYMRYCSTCHGMDGGGNGPVAGPPFGTGPFGLVLPVGGPYSNIKNVTDGHIYTWISNGSRNLRMPNYKRIPPEHRWDIVNYIREINGQGGRQ
jgi:mono/diheme cytochrome c family protein